MRTLGAYAVRTLGAYAPRGAKGTRGRSYQQRARYPRPLARMRAWGVPSLPPSDDTIVAIATAPGEAAIGVVRLSGPRSLPLLEVVLRPSRTGPWRGRQLRYGHLVNPSTGADVDEVMAVYLPPPATYTREATAEIYCHGGHLPAREVLRVLVQAGARIAEPGEFTLRAFVNGRIDLAQAEAVVAAVRSRTREGLQVAMAQLGGKLSGRVARVRRRVLGALAHLEASLDFPEDEVPPVAIEPDLALTKVGRVIERLLCKEPGARFATAAEGCKGDRHHGISRLGRGLALTTSTWPSHNRASVIWWPSSEGYVLP